VIQRMEPGSGSPEPSDASPFHPLSVEGRPLLAEIRSALAAITPGPVDELTARRLASLSGRLYRTAAARGMAPMAELAFSAEAVFATLGARHGTLAGGDLVFLANVVTAAEELLEALELGSPVVAATELLEDGFDHLLDRLEAA